MLRKLIIICASSIIAGCTSFNRDALWNAAIDENSYCTYWKGDFPIGSRFVHRMDDWTEKRLSWGYELKVESIFGENTVLVHGWEVFGESCMWTLNSDVRMKVRPIVVKVLDNKSLKVGEMFKEYGQYKYEKDVLLNGKYVPYLVQENTCEDLVAEPYGLIYHF